MKNRGEPIAAREHDELLVRADAHDRDDRDALGDRQPQEALAIPENDAIALSPGAKRVEIRAGVDEHDAALVEDAPRPIVPGPEDAEPLGVAAQRRVVEEEVVRQRMNGARGSEAVPDRERSEEPIGREQGAVVVPDEEHRALSGHVVDPAYLAAGSSGARAARKKSSKRPTNSGSRASGSSAGTSRLRPARP